jgi:nicotinamidase-related amidase
MSLAHEKYLELQRVRNAAPITLDPHRTALVIIDMQEYFLHPDSPLSRACDAQVPGVLHYFQEHGRAVAEPTLQRLLGVFRTHGMRVVYTTVASELPDGADLMPIFRERNAMAHAAMQEPYIPHTANAWARIVPSLTPQPNELVINKTTYGTFTSTGLDRALRNLGIDTLVIGGVVTNVCVETTARDAADHGYTVVVVDDACAAFSPEIHEAALVSFQGPFGRVRRADEVIALIEQGIGASKR